MSFVIPPQADASNLLDQNYDDFFSGPGFVTLSTPALPRHLTNARQSPRKVTGTIQTPAIVSGPIFGRILTTHSTTELEGLNDRAELQETHIPPHPSPLLSPPTNPFMVMDPPRTAPTIGTTSITNPGSPRLSGAESGNDPDGNFPGGLKSDTALSMASVITTKTSGIQPGIQSMSTSVSSHRSTSTHNTQIPRQPPIPASHKNQGPAQPRGNTSVKLNQATSKLRSGNILECEKTMPVSCVLLCQPSRDVRIPGQTIRHKLRRQD